MNRSNQVDGYMPLTLQDLTLTCGTALRYFAAAPSYYAFLKMGREAQETQALLRRSL